MTPPNILKYLKLLILHTLQNKHNYQQNFYKTINFNKLFLTEKNLHFTVSIDVIWSTQRFKRIPRRNPLIPLEVLKEIYHYLDCLQFFTVPFWNIS